MTTIDVKGKRNTKALRLKIYKAALEYFTEKIDIRTKGFCHAIHKATDMLDGKFSMYSYKNIYVELNKYDTGNSYWFPLNKKGIAMRIEILRTVIAEMEAAQ